MSWGEGTCIHYGFCDLEADICTCNTFCWAYEERTKLNAKKYPEGFKVSEKEADHE